jgi:hypothetical protein
MFARVIPSSFLTSIVIALRYISVWIALALLLLATRAIAPATQTPASFSAVLPLQRAVLFDRKLGGGNHLPPFTTTRDAIEFATIEGARANGLEHKVGTLTPGKEADVIMLRTDLLNVFPVNDPIGAVVWGMDTSNVDTVFVAGRALKREGRLLCVDLDRVSKMATESRDYVLAKSGFKPPTI